MMYSDSKSLFAIAMKVSFTAFCYNKPFQYMYFMSQATHIKI